jgi:hypothetical protein
MPGVTFSSRRCFPLQNWNLYPRTLGQKPQFRFDNQTLARPPVVRPWTSSTSPCASTFFLIDQAFSRERKGTHASESVPFSTNNYSVGVDGRRSIQRPGSSIAECRSTQTPLGRWRSILPWREATGLYGWKQRSAGATVCAIMDYELDRWKIRLHRWGKAILIEPLLVARRALDCFSGARWRQIRFDDRTTRRLGKQVAFDDAGYK